MYSPYWTSSQSDSLKASDLTFRMRMRLRLAKAPQFEQAIFFGAKLIFILRVGVSASMPVSFQNEY
jgi:hypothetical protein